MEPVSLRAAETRRAHIGRQVARVADPGGREFGGKRILVTGGTGSLGQVLVRRLLSGTNGTPEKITVFSREWRDIDGLWHVSTGPISKYDLLTSLRDALNWDIEIVPTDEPGIDRSLDSSRFRLRTGWAPRPWAETVALLAAERPRYEDLRQS